MNDLAPTREQTLIELPQPTTLRWQPLRIGLVELYHYDVEEFWFRDGHLLLRGNNGTGKSKVLSLTLPFLLDANLSASRVEPDGDRSKRMEWNLLMGKLYERRVGYTWIEFGRREQSGTTQTLTIGCGLRAIAGRSSADPWFFLTEQRIGEDLWLTTHDRTVLSRDRLIAAIGDHGEVFPTAETYRRAVDQRMFGLGTERYTALVNTLIQLRQPQLSKQPNEKRLSDALTESLSPLDQTALASVAEAMTELEDIRRSLDELEAMLKAVGAFGTRYRRYAQIEVRRRARWVRQAQTEYDAASRELNLATEARAAANADLATCRQAEQSLADQLSAVRARLQALRHDPRMIDVQTIDAASERAADVRKQLDQAGERRQTAQSQASAEANELAKRTRISTQTRAQLISAHSSSTDLSAKCRLSVLPSAVLGEVTWPDGVATLDSEAVKRFAAQAQDEEMRRREQIGAVRKLLSDLAREERALEVSRQAQRIHEEAFETAHESTKSAASRLAQTREELHLEWQRYCAGVRLLTLAGFDESFEALERWTSSLAGVNPMRAAVELAWRHYDAAAVARGEQIVAQRQVLLDERTQLDAEQVRLEGGELRPPPMPHTRGPDTRLQRPGAPLWQLVDFAERVSTEQRAQLEAALEAAGILDSWVLPEGILLDARTDDVLLTERTPQANSLAKWLVPTIPQDGQPALVGASMVAALLNSIACCEEDLSEAEAWVSPAGGFRLGVLRGSWCKPVAQYIGHTAREAARRTRLTEIAMRLDEVRGAATICDEEIATIATSRDTALVEFRGAPADERLNQAHANLQAQQRVRAEAQTRLGEAQSRVLLARNAAGRARDALELDARDLALPITADELAALEGDLLELRAAVSALITAIRDHQSALAEVATQAHREQRAQTELHTASLDFDDTRQRSLAADETLRTLLSTIGRKAEELLQAIGEADHQRRQYEKDEPILRANTETMVGNQSAANQKCIDLADKLDERAATRRRVMDELQAFATDTGFFAVAAPEIALPEGSAPWGVDAALSVARRAEQALMAVRAEESDWQRIQHDISGDLTELQTSMSAQGHSATAESSQGCLIVRIVYQQRPMRPDALEDVLGTELKEQKLILSASEREILEEHLEKEIAANLQRMITEAEALVDSMNEELGARPTSTGVRFRLDWVPVPEDDENAIAGLIEARRRLFKTSADAWSDEDRRQLGAFLQSRIEAERQREEHGTVLESLSRALDYRRWHRFSVRRKHYGSWMPLSGPASSGERALGLTVPLFAAASSHYESAAPHAPRLVLLDEAFAGIDDEARASCMGLIEKFDLDFVMTSEREWGCYAELPGLAICQIVRREGMDAVHVTRWTWDGRVRVRQEDPTRRFPSNMA